MTGWSAGGRSKVRVDVTDAATGHLTDARGCAGGEDHDITPAELALVGERAALAGLAVGAWIGATVLDVARAGGPSVVTLPDLLRLHADVLAVERAATGVGLGRDEVLALLARLDVVVDEIVDRARGDLR